MTEEDDVYVIHGPTPLEPLPNISLGKLIYESLLLNAHKKDALVDVVTGESISYCKILESSLSLAESLRKSGYGSDSIISVSSENNLYFFIPVISCLYIGATVFAVNPNYTEEETINALNICKPRIIFCSKKFNTKYVHLKQFRLPYIEKIIIIDSDDEIDGAETMNGFINKNGKESCCLDNFDLAEFDPNEKVALITFSSGTTGFPKAVMQTHKNLIHPIIQLRSVKVPEPFLIYFQFSLTSGLIINLAALIVGLKILVIKEFQEDLLLQTLQNYQVPFVTVVPHLISFLIKSPLVEKYDLSCLKGITCSGAPLSKEIEIAVQKRLKSLTVRQAYGLTETSQGVIYTQRELYKPGSCGQVAPYVSCKVRDPETGKSLGPGKVGELCFKGAMVVPGYYKNEEATKNMFTSDGWLLTGDLGYYDEDKYFYIVDRLKEVIKYKGVQVAPAELEAVLLNNSKIKDVGVVGLPDEEGNELPLAFVVKNDVSLTEQEVQDFVAEKVGPGKWLYGGVIFVTAIPKNCNGKILRRDLRKMLPKKI